MWYLHIPVNYPDLINCFGFRGKAAVNTKNCFIDESRYCEKIEDLTAIFPGSSVTIFGNALIVESINLFKGD